jgi:hypothetical protein
MLPIFLVRSDCPSPLECENVCESEKIGRLGREETRLDSTLSNESLLEAYMTGRVAKYYCVELVVSPSGSAGGNNNLQALLTPAF